MPAILLFLFLLLLLLRRGMRFTVGPTHPFRTDDKKMGGKKMGMEIRIRNLFANLPWARQLAMCPKPTTKRWMAKR